MRSASGTESKQRTDPDLMAVLWRFMAAWYRGLWTDSMGHRPTPEWSFGLADLAPHEIRKGIGELRRRGGKHPPSLPEFHQLCRPSDAASDEQRAFRARLEAEEQQHALPSPESLMERTAEGRASRAFCKLEGLLPMGEDTMEALDAALEGRDVEQYRRRHEAERSHILARYA